MNAPLRVLEVFAQSAGGIGRHVASLVDELDGRRGLELEIAGDPTARVPMPKPPHALTIPRGLAHHGPAIRRLDRLMQDGGFRLVHAHGLRAAVDAGLAARRGGRPVIFTAHNVIHPKIVGRVRARLLGESERVALRLATRIVAPSEEIKQHLVRRYSPAVAKIETIYLGVQTDGRPKRSAAEVRRELAVEGRPMGVTVARLAPQKALHVLLDAWRQVARDAVLAVLGEGPLERSLRSIARDMGIEPRVRWLGFQDDPGSYVAAANVFCLSSTWEAVALAAQEAVAAGVPVVTTDAGGMRELIEDRVSGRLVPVGDAAALAAAIDEVLASEKLGRRYAAAARETQKRKFSKAVMLDRIASLYHELGDA
ncbi:MAG: glycosyltransferase [Actinomycetota bacterium]